MQAIQTSSDDIVTVLLDTLKALKQSADGVMQQATSGVDWSTSSGDIEHVSGRLCRKQGVLVVETGQADEFDTNTSIEEIREERIQDLIKQSGL